MKYEWEKRVVVSTKNKLKALERLNNGKSWEKKVMFHYVCMGKLFTDGQGSKNP